MSVETKPKDKVFFCSAASRYAKEMLAGTASNYACFILVEYGDAFPAKLVNTKLEENWRKKMDRLAKEKKGKLVLIKNSFSKTDQRKIIFVDCILQRYCMQIVSVNDYMNFDLQTYINDKHTKWMTDSFFIVCTNGKKDKCCSKFGFPVFKFMEGMFIQGDVWECTHIGGDRFAANMVYLPYGIYYGRVTVEDVPNIVDSCMKNKIYLSNYRGLCTKSSVMQSVEYYMRKHLNDDSINFPIEIKHREQQENDLIFDISTSYGTFKISVTKQLILYPHLLTCTSTKRENVVKYLLNYIEKTSA